MAADVSATMAELYTKIKATANRAGRALHDDAGPLLSASGLHLQLLRLDHPELETEIDQISGILEQAFERIRAVSMELAPSPVLRGGLKNALERLAESVAAERPGVEIKLNYKATGELAVEAGCALYESAHSAIASAIAFGATRIEVTVRGVSIRIADNGRTRGRAKALAITRRIAEASGLLMTILTKQGTIVSIRYALRRPAGG